MDEAAAGAAGAAWSAAGAAACAEVSAGAVLAGSLVAAGAVGIASRDFATQEEALAIALQHAGVSEQDIFKVEIKLENEHGRDEYDIEFHAAGREYSYDIDAQSGEIINSESEIDD